MITAVHELKPTDNEKRFNYLLFINCFNRFIRHHSVDVLDRTFSILIIYFVLVSFVLDIPSDEITFGHRKTDNYLVTRF